MTCTWQMCSVWDGTQNSSDSNCAIARAEPQSEAAPSLILQTGQQAGVSWTQELPWGPANKHPQPDLQDTGIRPGASFGLQAGFRVAMYPVLMQDCTWVAPGLKTARSAKLG